MWKGLTRWAGVLVWARVGWIRFKITGIRLLRDVPIVVASITLTRRRSRQYPTVSLGCAIAGTPVQPGEHLGTHGHNNDRHPGIPAKAKDTEGGIGA